jgi:SAM-dependent methyltransferase
MGKLRQVAGRFAQSSLGQTTLDALGATFARPLVAKHNEPSLLPAVWRSDFITSVPVTGPVLEIGPFDRPWLSGPSVHYFDVLPQEGLKAKAATEPNRNPDGCPFIHYVSSTGDLSIVQDEFATIFSSHCIEHQPDLIHHLREVGRLLRRGGHYYLIVPDKRFCFDHFLRESEFAEVQVAKGRSLHTEKAVSEHALQTTHNVNILHWLGFHGHRATEDPQAQARSEESIKRTREGEYVDVHAWQFTPASFQTLVQKLYENGEIDLEPTQVHNTGFGRIEFMAVLTRTR